MATGPGKRNPTGPFKLVDVEAEQEVTRLSGPAPAGTYERDDPFELTQPWQRALVSTLAEVSVGLRGVQEGQATLEKGQAVLFTGQTELTAAFGKQAAELKALIPRVESLEARAKWKVWALRAGKAAIPLLAAVLGRYAPDLAKYLPDLLELFANFV